MMQNSVLVGDTKKMVSTRMGCTGLAYCILESYWRYRLHGMLAVSSTASKTHANNSNSCVELLDLHTTAKEHYIKPVSRRSGVHGHF